MEVLRLRWLIIFMLRNAENPTPSHSVVEVVSPQVESSCSGPDGIFICKAVVQLLSFPGSLIAFVFSLMTVLLGAPPLVFHMLIACWE